MIIVGPTTRRTPLRLTAPFVAIGIGCALLIGCALPVEQQQSFIPNKELEAISLVREAMARYQSGRHIEAELSLWQALAMYPQAENVQANLATVLEASGNLEKAEEWYSRLMQQHPEKSRYAVGMSRILYRNGQYLAAQQLLERTYREAEQREDEATQRELAVHLSALLYRVGDQEAARCYAAYAMAEPPTVPDIMRYGRVLIATGMFSTAGDVIDRFFTAHAGIQNAELRYLRALAHAGTGELESAREQVGQALTIGSTQIELEQQIRLLHEVLTPASVPGDAVGEADDDEAEEDEADFAVVAPDPIWPGNLAKLAHQLLEAQEDDADE